MDPQVKNIFITSQVLVGSAGADPVGAAGPEHPPKSLGT